MFIRSVVDRIVDTTFSFFYKSSTKRIPKPTNKLVCDSATTLAKKIRQRELSSEEVVRAFIDRIAQVNPLLNAVVDERFDEAIKEAQTIDKNIACGKITEEEFGRKPFLGVPFTTKETIWAQGLSNTFGLVSRKSYKANSDATVIRQMKDAGAILLSVTNVPQLSAWHETNNPVYGTTNNPYDVTRTAGGSSGGEASIVAACGSPFGIGSDLGGSLRNPAFMCGLFAHKPTGDLVSMQGVLFNSEEKENTMATIGPLTRHSEDLIPILKVLVGKNVTMLKLDESVDVTKIKVYFVSDPGDPFVSPIRKEMDEVLLKVVQHFTEILPEKPEMLKIQELKHGGRIWRHWIAHEPNVNLTTDLTNRESQVNVATEVLKFCCRRSNFSIGAILALTSTFFPQENSQWAQETTQILREKLTAILGTDGVLLYPSAPWPASYHNTAVFRPFNSNLFLIWNALKFCVTQVPLGLSPEGLPVGIQVVGAPFQDHLTIAVAEELEKMFGGYVPPFTLD